MDDKELVALLKQRDPRGLDALAQQYGPLLRYVIAPILEDRREREECLSDLHLLVWEKIGGYDRTKGSLSAWLSALARNTARNRGGMGAEKIVPPRSWTRPWQIPNRGRRRSC